MNTQIFIKEHLKNARLYRGLTLSELAEKTGITKQAISQYENGQIMPELTKLIKLADELYFPLEYFSSVNKYTVQTDTTYFRSLLSTTKSDRLAQKIRLEFIAQIYETLFDYVDFPMSNIPEFNFVDNSTNYDIASPDEVKQIEQIAMEVRNSWGLGDGPIKDLKYTLEANGIVVAFIDPKSEEISAFSQKIAVNDYYIYFVVLANNGRSKDRARFDMAHELGHIFLHPWSEDLETIDKEEFKKRETQANIFASAFLLPTDAFSRDIAVYNTNLSYYAKLKAKWNVSIKAMIYRAQQLGAISPSQYQYMMRIYSKNGWQKNEPGDAPFEMKNSLLQEAVMILLNNKVLSPEGFMWTIKRKGVELYSDDVEELLNLPKDMLKNKDGKPKLLSIKQGPVRIK